MWRFWSLLGWIKFHGWKNSYWSYDTGHWLCKHPVEGRVVFQDDGMTMCGDCGKVIE